MSRAPGGGWQGPNLRLHDDYLDPSDFPEQWKGLSVTVEVEAKAKELAVIRLMRDLGVQPPGRGRLSG